MWWILALACVPQTETQTDNESGVEVVDTGVAVRNVAVSVSEQVRTVATLTFEADAEAVVSVLDGDVLLEQWTSSGPSHALTLVGLPADETVTVRIEVDGEVAAETPVTTGTLPADLPVLTVEGEPDAAPRYLLVPAVGTTNAAIVVDRWGRVVWYHKGEPEQPLVRAFIAKDGSGVILCLAMGGEDSNTGAVQWLDWEGNLLREVEVPGLRMDALLHDDGTVTVITKADHPDYDALGDALVEVSPDGTLTEVFNTWEQMDPALDDVADIEAGKDWTHANALNYREDERAYYLTLGYLSTVVKVDRDDGSLDDSLFGRHNEWDVQDESEMAGVHQIDFTEQGLVVFNNGIPDRGYSRAVEYTLDFDTQTATVFWEHIPDPEVWVYVKGGVERLDSGNTLIVWSSAGRIEVVSTDNEVLWQLDADLGNVLLYADVLDTLIP